MKILGIDPGTAIVGWAVIKEEKGCLKPVAYGYIETDKSKSTAVRLKKVAQELRGIIKKHKPEESAVEDIFFFKNVKTAIKVSQARGVILLTLEELKVKIFEYTPLQIKQALTGYGRAEKRQMQVMTKNILNLRSLPKPDDVADALASAVCHINSRKINNLNN